MNRLHSLLVVTLTCSGCTFLALDEFDRPRCASNGDCEPLNSIGQDPCLRYQCAAQEHQCHLLPVDGDGDGDPSLRCGGQDCDDANARRGGNPMLTAFREVCDGVDNDCDGVVDDGAWRRADPVALSGMSAEPESLTVARRADGAMVVATTDASHNGSFAVLSDGAPQFNPLQYRRLGYDGSFVWRALDGCPSRGAPDVPCNVGDIAVSAAQAVPSRWFFAATNLVGCTDGQVRLGLFDESDRRLIQVDIPPPTRPSIGSVLAFGVDTTATQQCTGASRSPRVLGASRPAVVTVSEGSETPAAVAAWRARPNGGCGMSANLEALGVVRVERPDPNGSLIRWVEGNELPTTLGATLGEGRPALAAIGRGESVVGYGAADHSLALRVVGAVTRGPLSVEPAALLARPGALVDRVALALSDDARLGVAWQEGCAGDGGVWFATARVASSGAERITFGAPVRLSEAAGVAPAIAWVASGMISVGYTRGGATAASASETGGWVVAWSDPSGQRAVVGRRVLALDGAVLTEPLQEIIAGGTQPAMARGPFVQPTGAAELRVVGYSGVQRALVSVDLVCRPAG